MIILKQTQKEEEEELYKWGISIGSFTFGSIFKNMNRWFNYPGSSPNQTK